MENIFDDQSVEHVQTYQLTVYLVITGEKCKKKTNLSKICSEVDKPKPNCWYLFMDASSSVVRF